VFYDAGKTQDWAIDLLLASLFVAKVKVAAGATACFRF
jgi:hypothetical protein